MQSPVREGFWQRRETVTFSSGDIAPFISAALLAWQAMLGFPAMRKIDKLLLTAIIPPFLIALAVLTFIVFMDRLGRLSELLITRNASAGTVLMIAATIAPGVLIFSLPLSFLIGTLIGLSGLSGESQITALRACGVSLRRMLLPVMALSILVGLVTGVMSVYVLPETNDIYERLKNLISVRQAASLIVPRVFNEEFANVVFYVDDLSVDRQRWDRVFLADNSDVKSPRIVLARQGIWFGDQGGTRLQLHLENGTIYEVNPQDATKDNVSFFGSTDLAINLNQGGATEGDKNTRRKSPARQSTVELFRGSAGTDGQQRRDELVQLHQRFALPCSALGFALVGLSLGIRTRRAGRTYGSVIGLLLVMLFWVLFWNGSRLASVGALPPWLGVWGSDLILIGVGIGLFTVAEGHSRAHQTIIGWWRKAGAEGLVRRFHLDSIRATMQKLDDVAISSTIRIARARLPKVLDSYISRGFLAYFLWSALVCYLLFVVLTLFDLLDEIIRNRIAVVIVIRYFIFLTPQILLYVVPMSVLLAILIMFGILEKGSEVTAMKAGGWSLYRISVPVFLISSFICASIFFMQDYILPYANKEQDALRNLIKAKPVQTATKGPTWIFGESDRIFNYDYFDPNKDVFINLNIYEVNLRQQAIKRRVYARQAMINPHGEWTLEDGWVRDFQTRQNGFVPIKKATFDFPESAGYFEKEIFAPKESSKLTYFELKKYIDYLKQSGYNATELLVELHKKVSFPVSCFVMALLGVPFSFFMGRKGAFFGITASVAIAMSYWLVFNVFEQMGAYGMLSPVLAAWAPNLLFGAAGLAMLFTIRT